jgi:hypothetical protein
MYARQPSSSERKSTDMNTRVEPRFNVHEPSPATVTSKSRRLATSRRTAIP